MSVSTGIFDMAYWNWPLNESVVEETWKCVKDACKLKSHKPGMLTFLVICCWI